MFQEREKASSGVPSKRKLEKAKAFVPPEEKPSKPKKQKPEKTDVVDIEGLKKKVKKAMVNVFFVNPY